MKKKQYTILDLEKRSVDEDNATLEAVFSTKDEDRHGDIVEQNWDLKKFKKNPVILNSHAYNDAAEVIGKGDDLSTKNGNLEGKIQFAVNENPKAKVIYDLYAGGFLNAFSVGFIPKEFDDKGKITKSELLEISAVSVPSNAYALAKQKGIDVDKLYEGSNGDDIQTKKDDEEDAEDDSDGNQEKRGESDKTKTGQDEGAGKTKGTGKGETKKRSAEENGKVEDWYEGEGRIIYRERSLYEFEDGMTRVEVKPSSPKVYANVGILKGDSQRDKVVQSYIFPRDEGWTIDDSKKWVSTKNYDDLYLGKGMKESKDEQNKNDVILKAIEKERNRKVRALNKIYKAVELTSQELSQEELNSIQRQANNRLVNKAVKKLLQLKD